MKKILLVNVLAFLSFGAWAQCSISSAPTMPAAPAANLSGQALKDWLKQNWYDGKRTSLGYNTARDRMYGFVENNSNKVTCIYGGNELSLSQCSGRPNVTTSSYDTEHLIPQAFFAQATPYVDDIHHLYPTVNTWNNLRSSYKFAENTDAQTTAWVRGLSEQSATIPTTEIDSYSEFRNNGSSSTFEPREKSKGNVARSIFYFFTVHPTAVSNGIASVVADPQTLYQWHVQDPVDATEQERNIRTARVQGNYNPYIAHPELVARAWGFTPVAGDTLVSFVQSSGSVVEGNAGTTNYTISVNISPAPTVTKTVQVVVNATGTTATATDYTFTTQTLTFAPGVASQQASVSIVGDTDVEPNETIVLGLSNPSSGIVLGTTPAHTITVVNDDGGAIGGIPTVPLDSVRNARADGSAYMTGKSVRVYGTVYGVNINKVATNPKAFQFTLRDATNGVNIRNANSQATFTYNGAEGDSVKVIGKVEVFRGLTQIAVDSITRIATGRPIKTPTLVDALNEATESDLVKITNLTVVNWPAATGSGVTATATDGTTTFDIRIDADVNVFGTAAPVGLFNLTGLGSQFTTGTGVFTGGYQIMPRALTDIQLVSSVKSDKANKALRLFPNPAKNVVYLSATNADWTNKPLAVSVVNALGQTVKKETVTIVANAATLSIADLPQGIYSVLITSASETIQKQLVVTK